MKISRTISVDLDVWQAAVDAGIDRNTVCEKALKGATTDAKKKAVKND